ncbi:MAG: DODA-type extradiol aromatic ring-opening family dioxygenase [Elainellaceae cyanobacterium]
MLQPPALFISHGAPDLPIRTGATQDFLRRLPKTLPHPQAILVVSAHWSTAQPTLSGAIRPNTIYDFGGFSKALYQLSYPAPGDPGLAERAAKLLMQAGFSPQMHPTRGLDHGAWTPLFLAYPEAAIPVTQLSIQPHQSPAHHYRMGQAIASLRDDGVLIVGSGAATHNLGAFGSGYDAPPPDWVAVFDRWLAEAIARNATHRLLNYRQTAPHAAQNHPTEEHLLPLFVALGAGGRGRQIHQGFTYGAFSMAAYAFD